MCVVRHFGFGPVSGAVRSGLPQPGKRDYSFLEDRERRTGGRSGGFLTRLQICKSNTIASGLVQTSSVKPHQNGFATTSSTIASIAKVGISLAIRKNREECGIPP